MGKNEFLLPDELGWECNDEINDYLSKWLKDLLRYSKMLEGKHLGVLLEVSKAELTDNVYAIIKKYQGKHVKSLSRK